MSRQSELNSFISQLFLRLRFRAWLFGAAIVMGVALLTTIALVLVLNHYAFPTFGVKGGRIALLLALAIAATFGIVLPLIHLTPARAVRRTEALHQELEERLTTFFERQKDGEEPFVELLAADTLRRAEQISPSSLAPQRGLFALVGVCLGCLGTLIWMIAAMPGFMGYGAALLWTGPRKNLAPLYSMTVTPGNVTVRRNSDQLISAHIVGLSPGKVNMFARYQSANSREPVTMLPQSTQGSSSDYRFILTGLPEDVEYYVAAGPLTSQHYNVRVVDLPSVKKIRVRYQFPAWTGLKAVLQEQSGDLRGIEGTDAFVEVQMDKPLVEGKLTLDDNKTIPLSNVRVNTYRGIIHMDKDGAYHVAALDQGQPVRLSEDYFIATDKSIPPQVSITKPGGDYRATPIEEVRVGVEAADQFGLRDVHLHYSVNGGPDREVDMLKTLGAKNADGSHTIRLEDFKLVPGDLVSLYATAKDGHSEARTDISFVQVDPFEREFSQSQQGGGGGGQNNETDMSKREKELIAATWKQQNDRSITPKDAVTAGQFLAEAQQKLRDQVLALSARMKSRDLSEANEEFNSFEKNMQVASEAMAPSSDKLKATHWKDALPLEQKALQALLRAEATFRQIQVAFGQQGSGGGGANSSGRDLASLFDLELDTEKNQYETAQNISPAEQQQKEINDVLAKLDALAKRQEEISKQQQNPQESFQDRWQQEMLRREAEELQRQLEQLAQKDQQNKTSQQASSSSSRGASWQQPGKQQQQNSSSQSSGGSQDQRIEQALNQLRQAGEAMKRSDRSQQSSDAARQAADRLQEAKNLLGASQQQRASGKLGALSQEADRLAQEERAQTNRINKFASQEQVDATDRDSITARLRERNQLAGERQQLSTDLSRLQKDLRDSARTLAPNQPKVAEKLRDAITEMDESDLDNRVQRTADWLRRGINPNSNNTETEIAQGLQKLGQQLREAQKAIGQGSSEKRSNPGDQTAALDQIQRLRRQLEAMSGAQNGQRGDHGQEGKNGMSRDQNSSNRNGQNTLSGQRGSRQQSGNRANQAGNVNDEIRNGGGGYDGGAALGNINTGNNTYAAEGAGTVPRDSSGNPQDTEQTFQQKIRELNRLGDGLPDDLDRRDS